MEPRVFTKKVTTVYKTETYNINDVCILVKQYADNKLLDQYYTLPAFVSKTGAVKKGDQRWFYCPDFKEDRNILTFSEILDKLNKIKDKPFPIENVDTANIICSSFRDHTIRSIHAPDYPVSIPMEFDNVRGITNRYFRLKDGLLLTHLKNHPYILNAENDDIPSYNQDRDCNKGLIFRVLLPQEVFNTIWDFYADDKRNYQKGRVEEEILCKFDNLKFDPLNIRQFKKSKDKINI